MLLHIVNNLIGSILQKGFAFISLMATTYLVMAVWQELDPIIILMECDIQSIETYAFLMEQGFFVVNRPALVLAKHVKGLEDHVPSDVSIQFSRF